jgi:hypothetical protein
MIPIIRSYVNGQLHRSEEENGGCQELKQKDCELLISGHKIPIVQYELFLEICGATLYI